MRVQRGDLRRGVGLLVVLTILAVAVVLNRGEIKPTGQTLVHADLPWLLAGVVFMILWVLVWAGTYLLSRRAAGVEPKDVSPYFVRLTLACLFANASTKTAGLAAMGLFNRDAAKRGLARGPVHAGSILATLIVDVAFVVTLVAGLVAVVIDHTLTTAESLAAVVVIVVLAARTVVVIAASSRKSLLYGLFAIVPRTVAFLRRRPIPAVNHESADEVFEAMALIRSQPARIVPAFVCAVFIDILGVAILWASIGAIGAGNHLTIALIAYAVSSLFAVVSILPGGIGFVEVGATAILVQFNISVHEATAAVIIFRLLEFWIPTGLGAFTVASLFRGPKSEKELVA